VKINACDFLENEAPPFALPPQGKPAAPGGQNLPTIRPGGGAMNSYAATVEQFTQWLRAYQGAWEGRDSAAAAKLFTDDACYFWTPLVPPQQGPAEIAAAWNGAVSQQRDIRFTYEVFGVAGNAGMARWRADFTRLPDQFRVRIEGVLSAEFASGDKCRVFREWWHASESPG
jgi:ketosteroid isomerase-like protein